MGLGDQLLLFFYCMFNLAMGYGWVEFCVGVLSFFFLILKNVS